MIVIAPYSGDPTWDFFDAFFMSVLTYLTAPWALGAIVNVVKRKLGPSQAFVAFCFWMFSASWSYDLYLVLRDGAYPITWFSNIFASSVLYISAGLFWSLDWIPGRGVTFAFLEDGWPYSTSESSFPKIVWFALPFMALVSFLIIYFFWFKARIWGSVHLTGVSLPFAQTAHFLDSFWKYPLTNFHKIDIFQTPIRRVPVQIFLLFQGEKA